MKPRLSVLALALSALPVGAEERVDLATIHRIKEEASQGSKVMEHMFYLTDVHGPRTASPNFVAAADWAVQRLLYAPLAGAWSSGTNGPVSGDVVMAPLFAAWEDEDRFDLPKLVARTQRFSDEERGKLSGKIVMIEPVRELALPTEPPSQRYDDAKLASVTVAPEPSGRPAYDWPLAGLPPDPKKRRQLFEALPEEVSEEYFMRILAARAKLNAFLRDEGVLGVLTTDRRGGGIVFAEQAGPWEKGAPVPPPVIVLPQEPYAHGPAGREEDPGHAGPGRRRGLPRRGRGRRERHRRDPGDQEEGRGRHARRPPRLVERRDGRGTRRGRSRASRSGPESRAST